MYKYLLITWMLLSSFSAFAEESLCAQVKIEILQEVSMERQGFEALMRVTNSLDSYTLDNVSVTVNFKDANGNPVVATSNTSSSDAAFFIRVDGTRDITGISQGVDGVIQGGSIAPKTVGEMRWLIIPTAKAAGQTKDGKLYYVGAQLKYSYGGKEEVVDVAADSIVVKPQPALTLDYFLTQEIIGDDAFTTEVEPAEPYTLGVRITNNGYGYAKSVKIESAQPTIVENKQGLAAGFKILGSYLNDLPSTPTLLLNFGNIEPKGVTNGRWIMETNLAGSFIQFKASFTHADELGGELTSLLQGTNAHFLIRDVLVDLPGRDKVRDFLAFNAQQDVMVYESEPTGLAADGCTDCAAVNKVDATLTNGTSAVSNFSHLPQSGFSYAQAVDPNQGKRILLKVLRADGSSVHPQNVWLSKKRAADKIHFDYFINIFDKNSLGAYTLYWGGDFVDTPQAPVIQFISDQITYEGGHVSFVVNSTDPNKTIPQLSLLQTPAGASFSLSAANTGVFSWHPAIGQKGIYPLHFSATDGELTSERSMTIIVNPANDTDGDGMDDAWEIEHFGDLSHDGLADSDGDGRSDLQEFLDKTNPKVLELSPAAPQILSPIFNADTLQGESGVLQPTLTVTNGTHPTGVTSVNIVYEVYRDESLTELIATGKADEGTGTTSLKITPLLMVDEAVFEDNHIYYWRAKSQQKVGATASSAWVKSKFFINTHNDAPSVPQISSPLANAVVAQLSPVMIVSNATDVDRDTLSYDFAIYSEGNLSTPVASVSAVEEGINGQTEWHLPIALQEDHRYVWQAIVKDGKGAAIPSAWGSFLVSLDNAPPSNPQVFSPAEAELVKKLQGDSSVVLTIVNSTDPENSALKYYFEADKVNTFDSADVQRSPAVVSGNQDKTSWTLNNLVENQTYYWRIRAFDGEVSSDWVVAQFTFSRANENPSVPTVYNPATGALVSTNLPLLEVNPATDPEGKPVSYRFQLYADAQMATLISEKLVVNPLWQIDFSLADLTTYYWRARAEDPDNGQSNWSALSNFTVKLPVVNQAPTFSFVLPSADKNPATGSVLIQWTDSDPDSDALINLYATDAAGNRTTIVSGLHENSDGEADQYVWDLSSVAAGTYRVSAEISDEQSVVTVNSCCLLTVPQASTTPLPISEWHFDENTGQQTYSSIGNRTGLFKVSTVNTTSATLPTWIVGRTQQAGSAIKFDGTGGYVELPKAATDKLLTTASMTFWVNATAATGGVSPSLSPAVIGSDVKNSGNDIQWGSLGNLGNIGLAVGDVRLMSMYPVTGSWHHVAITRDVPNGNTTGLVKIYVDSILHSVGMPSNAEFTGVLNTLFGFGVNGANLSNSQLAAGTKFFNGALDDVAIYDRVLTKTEIENIFTASGGSKLPVGGSGGSAISPPSSYYGIDGIYQAESATLYLGQVANNNTGYSAFGFADYDAVVGSYVEWVVDQPSSGNVTLKFRYSNGNTADRPMSIMVNGTVVNASLSFPYTTNWTTWNTVSIVVNLNQGTNVIRATAKNSLGGPNVDYLKVE